MSRVDLVIFGATGFTGKHAVEKLVSLAKKYPRLTWAVAGRTEKKLKDLMFEVSKKTGEDLSEVKVIVADVGDEKSLKVMCEQAKVVVNCCGPYRFYGEPVVRAAIESNTHYVDVNGEPQFMEMMQLEYSSQAADAGVYIISACGFDSIPNDLGVLFLKQNFNGTLNAVESYLSSHLPAELQFEAFSHGSIHYGTWESLVYGLANDGELKSLRKKLYPETMPTFRPKLHRKPGIHKKDDKWCLPFPGSDESVVYRSQRYFYQNNQRPIQFTAYVQFSNIFYALGVAFFGIMLYLLSKIGLTRNLLLSYPKLFSFGMVTKEGPTERVMDNTRFTFELYGIGWDEGCDVDTTPKKKVVAKVSGTNPGYGATVVALLLSGITILKQQDKMPGTGGVLTTAVAFENTDLIKKLNENELTFEIV